MKTRIIRFLSSILLLLIFAIYFYSCTPFSRCKAPNAREAWDRADWAMYKYDNDLYYDGYEVLVSDWLTYYSWIANTEGFDSAKIALPDSNEVEPVVWKIISNPLKIFNQSLIGNTMLPLGYFNKDCKDSINNNKYSRFNLHGFCEYLNHPITGITYEQAVNFCNWKTKIRGFGKLTFRLPTEKEWKNIALIWLAKKDKVNGMPDSISKDGCPTFNYSYKSSCEWILKHNLSVSRILAPYTIAWSGDIFGNVSEMTLEKGIAKGGNYMLYANQCHVDSVQKYSKPEKWLGFRCVGIYRQN